MTVNTIVSFVFLIKSIGLLFFMTEIFRFDKKIIGGGILKGILLVFAVSTFSMAFYFGSATLLLIYALSGLMAVFWAIWNVLYFILPLNGYYKAKNVLDKIQKFLTFKK